MPVVINDFETLAEPPRPVESQKQASSSREDSKAALVAAAEFAEAVRRQIQRYERVRAH
jgi:hypothetical protein